ncbi:hypothetical protein [Entomobacter blattae]|nr:hypothetical protein [Entomobacter blattae]
MFDSIGKRNFLYKNIAGTAGWHGFRIELAPLCDGPFYALLGTL